MNCSYCNSEITEDTLICPGCNQQVAINRQSKKIDEVKQRQKTAFEEIFKSKWFLAYSIVMSVIFLIHLLNVILNVNINLFSFFGVTKLLIWISFIIAPLITMITSWKLFTGKDPLTEDSLLGLRKFPSFYRSVFKVIRGIAILITTLVGIGLIIISTTAKKAIDNISSVSNHINDLGGEGISSLLNGASDLLSSSVVLLVIICVVLAVLVFLAIHFFVKTYNMIDTHYDTLAQLFTTGIYPTNFKYPATRTYVVAGIFIALGLPSFIGGKISLGLCLFANGIYLILAGLFFSHTEKVQSKFYLELQKENNVLGDIRKRTTALLSEQNRIERAKEREKLLLQQQQQQQQQQQLIMQQMMNQFIAQNMNQFAQNQTNATPPSAPATTAQEEVAPTEGEKPTV